ncbi:MAG: RluA family pseudouridine synthase [Planctomycetaceae bacterium]
MDPAWIIHRDARLIVLDTPSGLLAVPGRGPDLQDCLAARVHREFPAALVVHRLDRDTSGLLLMALDAEAQRHASRQFEARTVRKVYRCVVSGAPAADEGLVDLPIGRDLARPPRYRIDHDHGRPSQTRWRVLERRGDTALLEVAPLTGRSHQIRLHLAVIGHPILGDPLYADEFALRGAPRLLLHATELALAHPDERDLARARDFARRVAAALPASASKRAG